MTRPCPLCESKNRTIIERYNTILEDTNPLSGDYYLCSCDNCGFVYNASISTEIDYSYYYRTLSKYQYRIDKKEDAQTLAKVLDRKNKYLEIGAGNGDLIKELKELGLEVTENKSNSCHGIILDNVLDHVYNLREFMCNNIDTEYCYVRVPLNYIAKDQTLNINHEHINHFSYRHLDTLFSLSGYSRSMMLDRRWVVYKKDTSRADNIRRYIIRPFYKMPHIDKRFIVFGAGSFFNYLLGNGDIDTEKIEFIVDSNRLLFGRKIKGIRILYPKILKIYEHPILVCSITNKNQILKTLKDLNINNDIFTIKEIE